MNYNIGDRVQIGEITDPKLSFLSHKEGLIVQILDTPIRKSRGYWVKVVGINETEKEWFIDYDKISKIKK